MKPISHTTDPPPMNLLNPVQLDFELTNRQEQQHMLAQMSPAISSSEPCYSRQTHASTSLLHKAAHVSGGDGQCNYVLVSGPVDEALPEVFGDSDDEEDEDDLYELKIQSAKRRRLCRDDAHDQSGPDYFEISNADDDIVEHQQECDPEDPFADPDPEAYHRQRVYEWTWSPSSRALPSITLTPPDNDDYQTVLSLCHANHTPIQDSCFSNQLTVPTYVALNNLPCGYPRGLGVGLYESEHGLERTVVPAIEVQRDIGARGLLLSEVWISCSVMDEDEVEDDDAESEVPSLDSSRSSSPVSQNNSPVMQQLELAPCTSISLGWDTKTGMNPIVTKLASAFDDEDDDFFSQDPAEWFNTPSRF